MRNVKVRTIEQIDRDMDYYARALGRTYATLRNLRSLYAPGVVIEHTARNCEKYLSRYLRLRRQHEMIWENFWEEVNEAEEKGDFVKAAMMRRKAGVPLD